MGKGKKAFLKLEKKKQRIRKRIREKVDRKLILEGIAAISGGHARGEKLMEEDQKVGPTSIYTRGGNEGKRGKLRGCALGGKKFLWRFRKTNGPGEKSRIGFLTLGKKKTRAWSKKKRGGVTGKRGIVPVN